MIDRTCYSEKWGFRLNKKQTTVNAINSNMLRLICLIPLIFLAIFSNAQGSWNIGYIPVDSINAGHIGRTVKIDFRTPVVDGKPPADRNIRSYVEIKDTVFMNIDSTLFHIAERRKIYVDHGSYRDQFLECINCQNLILRIYDAEILEVDQTTILFSFETEINRQSSEKPDKTLKTVRIERVKLDGVMYKL
jgi:hypothetical protein